MDEHFLRLSVLVIITGIVMLLFSWTLFSLLRRIPRNNQIFPSWFVWLFVVPYIGLIFQWIMLPFGIPNALKKHFATHQDAIHAANVLFKLGLAQAIVAILSLVFAHILGFYLGWLGIALWLIYWGLIIRFRMVYFK
ncbi:MAG: hypothetical protein COY58_07200 [Gammaproteobacteria bacterium CG_4_10_14_0_8_um_filter_38_16]|nr:MAG: hypothetical protein COY58_07200 [Gammaproteobacteria bacterium CG_4_10_14_0_8_um_filter_38_16]PJA04012.1 MAG: hypothetical protein COX72_02105 [Gammaproteobacteria bacterium CG_4_10_14_0_2_um_filter_38_22]PJB11024.1 MAG: hypothetical protein CO120_01880 [Gammaproteobacteria bacterium CG_4_9_14_3_um_filter_38_9]